MFRQTASIMCTGSKHNKTRFTSVRAAVAVVLLSVLFAWSGNAAVSGAAVSNYVRTYVFTDSTGSDSHVREQTQYYDGLGRLRSGISDDSLYSESIDTDLDANVRSLRRVFRGADIQNSVISYTAGMATGVRDVSAPYYGERVGRIPAGDYTLAYDVAGRLVADGTRGITGITYKDWSDIPQSVTAAGFSVFSDVSADGKLRLRRTHVPYIETVIKVNSKGDTIVSQRKRTLTRSSQFFGCFENATTPAGSHLRVNTPVGFYDLREKRQYWYLTNRQESVMALVDSEGNVHRRSALYPSGTPFVLDGDDDNVPDAGLPSDRHHIGNHWISFGGLDWYDNTARMHDPVLMHFITPDKHAYDYTPLSPWSHCAANPVNLIDPDGLDARIIVKDHSITVKANVILTGNKANSSLAGIYQRDIMSKWGSISAVKYKGEIYNVTWDVKVRTLRRNEKRDYNGINNYMEVVDKGKTSAVEIPAMNRGKIRNGSEKHRYLKDDCPMSHEFGHLLGIADKYETDHADPNHDKPIDPKWDGDIMAEAADEDVKISSGTLTILFKGVLDKHLENSEKWWFPTNIFNTTEIRNRNNHESW